MASLFALFAVGMFLSAAIGALAPLLFLRLYRLRKSLIIWLEPNSRNVELAYENVKDGTIRRHEKIILLEGQAKHTGKNGTWLVDPVSGWNWRAPSRSETYDAKLTLAVLEPSNPGSYHKAIHRHRWHDIFRAGEDKDKWASLLPILGIIGLIALFAILGALIWLGSKVAPAAVPPAGG